MLVFVVFYALIAMALAQARPLQEAPAILQSLGYIVLGLAWTLPLMPLIKWMERPDRQRLKLTPTLTCRPRFQSAKARRRAGPRNSRHPANCR